MMVLAGAKSSVEKGERSIGQMEAWAVASVMQLRQNVCEHFLIVVGSTNGSLSISRQTCTCCKKQKSADRQIQQF
jgi:hypothetical protein